MSTGSRRALLLLAGAVLALPSAVGRAQEKPKGQEAAKPAMRLLPAGGQSEDPAAKEEENPVQQIDRELGEADQKVIQEYLAARDKGATDEELQAILAKRPDPASYIARMKQVIAAHPGTDLAFDGLVWTLTHDGDLAARGSYLSALMASWAESPKMVAVLPMLRASEEGDRKVLAQLAESPVREVKGVARFLSAKAMADDPAHANEAEQLLEQCAQEYGDLSYRKRLLRDLVQGQLNEIRLLGIGKVAPEIEGPDLDGTPFKLSDYRGKVILLDFWGHW